jgi:branched-chain amino acid transport system substrate-binding protein
MESRRKFIKRIGTTALASAIGPAIARGASEAPVRVGFALAKTGVFAAAVPAQANSYELWKDLTNQAGGLDIAGQGKRPIEFVQYDDQSNPSQDAKIYEKLITQDKVDLLLAPWGTPGHIAIAPVVERFKFPVVGNSAASASLRDLKPGNIWFVAASFPDRVGPELAQLLKANNVKSIALLTNVLPFGKEVKSFFEPAARSHGIEILVNEEYPPDVTDMSATLAKVKQANPDAVIALSYPSDSILYVKQAKELNIPATFEFILIGPAAEFFSKILGSAIENVVTIGQWTPKLNAAAASFNEAYIAKFKERPDYLDSIEPYASCQILQQAVKTAGLNRDKLRETIANGKFETILGEIRFKGVENAVTKTGFLQVQNGVPQQIWPASEATASYQPKTSW